MITFVWYSLLSTIFLVQVKGALYDEIGSNCTHLGKPGLCTSYGHCQYAVDNLAKERPTMCRAPTYRVVVCCVTPRCPPPRYYKLRIQKDGRKARDKCIDWYSLFHPCIVTDGGIGRSYTDLCRRVVSPFPLPTESEFPHMALLGYGDDKNKISWECSGTLISDEWILTTARCTSSHGRSVSTVRTGVYDIKVSTKPDNTHLVSKIIIHPNYSSDTKLNDIALLKVEKKITFSESVIPACLHIGDELEDNKVMATGWGLLNTSKKQNSTLVKMDLEKLSPKECSLNFPNENKNHNGTQICYRNKNSAEKQCKIDSGSPIQIHNDDVECAYTVMGIKSFEKDCNTPDSTILFTKISPYIAWIENIVWP